MATTVQVKQITGQAWMRQPDGSLVALREGTRIPVDADVVTANGSQLVLELKDGKQFHIGENQSLALTQDLLSMPEAAEAAVAEPSTQEVDAIITALNEGRDPLEELDPTEAVLTGGEGAGSTYVRLANVIETTSPLDLAYGRGGASTDPDQPFSGGSVNLPPVVQGSAAALANEDSDLIAGVEMAGYFRDPENGALTFSASNLPWGLSIDPATGRISGTLDSSASQGGSGGVYTVVVTATDPIGASTSMSFVWTVTNPAPDAADDSSTVQENVVLSVGAANGLLKNDVDRDGDDLEVVQIVNADNTQVAVGQPIAGANGGLLTVNADGSYTFEQGTDFDYLAVGDSVDVVFRYTISDGDGGFDTAELRITITGTNDGPVAAVVERSVQESGIAQDASGQWQAVSAPQPVTGNVLDDAKDVDQGEQAQLQVTGVWAGELADPSSAAASPPSSTALQGEYGELRLDSQGQYTYVLHDNSAKVNALRQGDKVYDVFTYEITDPQGAKDWAEIRILVLGTNDAPVALPDANAVTESGVAPGGNTAFTPSDQAKGNVLTTASDADQGETASLTVKSWSWLQPGATSATTADAGQSITTPYGELKINADGSYVYTLNNASTSTNALALNEKHIESFEYVVVDVQGASVTSSLTITITGTNDRPEIDIDVQKNWDTDVKESDNGAGGDASASGDLVASDADNGAQLTWKWVENDSPVNASTVNGQYGSIEIVNGRWVYTLDQDAPQTQALGEGEVVFDTFTVRVLDEHGAWDEQQIRVRITGTNDAPIANDDTIVMKEDGRVEGNLITGAMGAGHEAGSSINADRNADGGSLKVITFTVDGQSHTVNDQPIEIPGANGYSLGTLTIKSNGDYIFVPAQHFSGKLPEIRYTVQEPLAEGGKTAEAGLSVEVIPVADAPLLNDPGRIRILEDASTTTRSEGAATWIGLRAPEVTDNIDRNGATVQGDDPERLGEITLTIDSQSFAANSQGWLNIAGQPSLALDKTSNVFKIVIVDDTGNPVNHVSDVARTGVLQLTKEQYENLTITTAAHRGENISVKVQVTSYEVDANGVAKVGLLGASSSTQTEIDVWAVTDPVDLQWNDPSFSDQTPRTLQLTEDTNFNLKAQFQSLFEDKDGSEDRWFTITNNSDQAIFVNNVNVAAGATSKRIEFTSGINIKGAQDYSGDVKGLVLTLHAKDRDADSPDNSPIEKTDQLQFDLQIAPLVDPIGIRPTQMVEDTPKGLWAVLGLTMGDSTDGSQTIAEFTLNALPTGWVLQGPDGQPLAAVDGKYAFVSGAPMTLAQLRAVLEGITVIPLQQSSKDIQLTGSWKVLDADLSNPGAAPVEQVGAINHKLVITPAAEYIPGNNAAPDPLNFNDDLKMTEGHDYGQVTTGQEDQWFALNVQGFNLGDGWINPDNSGKEQTFARLTPVLEQGAAGDSVNGSWFRYQLEDGSWREVEFKGTPIDVEKQYLHTLEFRAPNNVSGHFKIKVEAKTIDYDEDNAAQTVTKVSGGAWLNLLVIAPQADGIDALAVTSASGLEDKPIALHIAPSSVDASETFDVRIDKIPAGAQIVYDGQTVDAATASGQGFEVHVNPDGSWRLIIENFLSSKDLAVIPPPQSNENFALDVSARSVDTLGQQVDKSDFQKHQDLKVSVKGVADEVEIVSKPVTLTEQQVESGGHVVALDDAIDSIVRIDNDGSETLNFRITGLEPGFNLQGAYPVTMGHGTERVWVVKSEAQLRALKISTPEHYSGTLKLTVIPVTTENDNDWHMSQAKTLDIVVTPTPESAVVQDSVVREDTTGAVRFAIADNFGDTNESLDGVWIKASDITPDKGFELFIDGQPLLGRSDLLEDGYYKLGSELLGSVTGRSLTEHFAHNQAGGAFGFGVKYVISDASSDGTVPKVTEVRDGVYDLHIQAVTDPLQADFVGVTVTQGAITPDGNTVAVTSEGNFGVRFNLQTADRDGSEQVTQLEIAGIPDGLVIEGLNVNGVNVGSVSFIGNNAWIVSIPSSQMPAFTGAPLQAQLNFRAGELLGQHKNLPITITTLSKDTGADSVAAAPVKFLLDSTLPGNAPPSVVNLTWGENSSFSGTEDQPFTLEQAFNSTLVVNHANPNVHFTLKLTLPEGATITYRGQELTPTSLGGADGEAKEAWVVTGYGGQADINAMLRELKITPPPNVNDNFGGLKYDATLTAYHEVTGSQDQEVLTDQAVPLTPVTDDTGLTIGLTKAGTGDKPEEGSPVDVRIQIGNGVDGGSELGEFLYVQLQEPVGFKQSGRLLDAQGNEVQAVVLPAGNAMGLPEGTYYQVVLTDRTIAQGQTETIKLTYEPAGDYEYTSGTLTVNAWAQRKETDANGGLQTVSQSGSASLEGVSNGYDVEVEPELSMGENQGTTGGRIQLEVEGGGLRDATDGSEAVFLALLNNVPKGFVVYVGQDAGSAVVAPNAGNSEGQGASWAIEVVDGKLPPYIAIQPPKNWSGVIEGLELSVISGEIHGEAVVDSTTMRLEVRAKADGLQEPVEADAAFNTEGQLVRFNLNLSMKDARAAVPDSENPTEHKDSSIETLQIRFAGLGEHAAFYVGEELLAFNGAERGFSFDASTGKYTVYGLSQSDSEKLSVLQSKQAAQPNITFEAWTKESENGDLSEVVTGSFEMRIDPQAATNGQNNVVMFDGVTAINGQGGFDTVWMRFGESLDFSGNDANLFKNIEQFDLTREGFDHELLNLSAEAVAKMTDNGNKLTIKANAGDTISLKAEDGWNLVDDGGDMLVYTNTPQGSSPSVTLHISKEADLQIPGNNAQGRMALASSDMFDSDSSSTDSLLGSAGARSSAPTVVGTGMVPGEGQDASTPAALDPELQQKMAQQMLEQARNANDSNGVS